MTKSLLEIMEDVIFLKKYTFFSEVDTEDLKALAMISQPVALGAGDLIVKEGDLGDSFFLIKAGSVKITKGEGEKQITLAVLPAHAGFGEMAIFEDTPRSANCYANEDCQLLKISREDLLEVIMEQPRISVELLRVFGRRLRESNEKVRQLSESKK